MTDKNAVWRPWKSSNKCRDRESSQVPLWQPWSVVSPSRSSSPWSPPQPLLSPLSSEFSSPEPVSDVSKPVFLDQTPHFYSAKNRHRSRRKLPFTSGSTVLSPATNVVIGENQSTSTTCPPLSVPPSSSSFSPSKKGKPLSKQMRLAIPSMLFRFEVENGNWSMDQRAREVAKILKIAVSTVYKYRNYMSPKKCGRKKTVRTPSPKTPIRKRSGKKWSKNKAGPHVVNTIFRMSQSGISSSSIAHHLSLKPRHVRLVLQRVRISGLPSLSPEKTKKQPNSRSFKFLDPFFKDLIKRTLDSSYSKNIIPTLSDLLQQLIEITRGSPEPFPYKSTKTLSCILKQLGYKLKKIER